MEAFNSVLKVAAVLYRLQAQQEGELKSTNVIDNKRNTSNLMFLISVPAYECVLQQA